MRSVEGQEKVDFQMPMEWGGGGMKQLTSHRGKLRELNLALPPALELEQLENGAWHGTDCGKSGTGVHGMALLGTCPGAEHWLGK